MEKTAKLIRDYEKKAKKLRPLTQAILPDEEFKKLVENEVDAWKFMAKDMKTEGFSPMVVLYILNGGKIEKQAIMIPSGMGDDHNDRMMCCYKLGQEFGKNSDKQLIGATLATECWYAKVKKDEAMTGKVSDRPDRVEAVTISTESIDARYGMVIMDIKRDKDNVISFKKPRYEYLLDSKNENSIWNPLIHAIFEGYKIGQIERSFNA